MIPNGSLIFREQPGGQLPRQELSDEERHSKTVAVRHCELMGSIVQSVHVADYLSPYDQTIVF